MGLSIKSVEAFIEKEIHTIEADFTWLKGPAHIAAIKNDAKNILDYASKAIPIVEGLAKMILPGEAPVIDSVASAASQLDVKLSDFVANPSIGTFTQIGGQALKNDLLAILPSAQNGINIAGVVIKDAQTLNNLDPSIFQSIVGSAVTSYINSAGNVDISIQQFLSSLSKSIVQSAAAAPAPSAPAVSTTISAGQTPSGTVSSPPVSVDV